MDALRNQAREALLQRRSSLRGSRSAGEVLERLSERERRELRDIDDALVRLEQGGFGHCARCGGAIGRHRLRAIPEARHCMACSEQAGR
jgi:DnaK suppressor protein